MPQLRTVSVDEVTTFAAEREKLAINIYDLMRVHGMVIDLMVKDNLDRDRDRVIQVDKEKLDETAIPFTCNLLTAACICDTIRNHDRKVGVYPTRVYIKRVNTWYRLTHGDVLTEVVDGQVRLNPAIFRIKVSSSMVLAKKVI